MISNPRSYGHRHAVAKIEGAAGVLLTQPADRASLLDTLHGFAASGIDLVVVNGGDGTLRDVMSALPTAYPDMLPELAILRAGNTNLAARMLEINGSGPQALDRLIAAVRTGRVRRQACAFLEVAWIGQPSRPRLRGFFLGAAAFADAKRLADEQIHRRGVHQGAAVGLTLATTILHVLTGRGPVHRGTPISTAIDDSPARDGHRFLLLVTTLDRLMLGLWPFWGAGSGHINWLEIDAPPRFLPLALPAIVVRRLRDWMPGPISRIVSRIASRWGYRSGRAARLAVRLERPFVLDGEFFEPGPDGVLLTSPGHVTIVIPE
ncbi:MAG: diacylglycerol/lipid kinase family protein [Janthinobacterium lividum]